MQIQPRAPQSTSGAAGELHFRNRRSEESLVVLPRCFFGGVA